LEAGPVVVPPPTLTNRLYGLSGEIRVDQFAIKVRVPPQELWAIQVAKSQLSAMYCEANHTIPSLLTDACRNPPSADAIAPRRYR